MDPYIRTQVLNAMRDGKIPGARPYTDDPREQFNRQQQDNARRAFAMDPNKSKAMDPFLKQQALDAPFADQNAISRYVMENKAALEDGASIEKAKRRANVRAAIREQTKGIGGGGTAEIRYDNPGSAYRINPANRPKPLTFS